MAMDLRREFRHERIYFLLLIFCIWAVVLCFVLFQYSRERKVKAEELDFSLQMLNTRAIEALADSIPLETFYEENASEYSGLRLTSIDTDGKVLFDSYEGDKVGKMENHLSRPEIAQAIKLDMDIL